MSASAWADFLESITAARREVSAEGKGAWFRGHRVGEWDLRPRLLRSSKGLDREETLFVDFYARGAQLLSSGGDWHILSQMQHFGVPTRLLDWTEKLNVALYFALNGPTDAPCVWVLNPFLLTAKCIKNNQKVIMDPADDPELSYRKHWRRQHAWPFELPLPIISPWKFARIDHQGGFFTVHGNDYRGIEITAPRLVRKVPIPPAAVGFCRQQLADNGVDGFSIFKDLDALGDALRLKYGLS